MEALDIKRVRGILAEAQITHAEYAKACKLSRVYLSQILTGTVQPGELARIRMQRGLVALGLDREAVRA